MTLRRPTALAVATLAVGFAAAGLGLPGAFGAKGTGDPIDQQAAVRQAFPALTAVDKPAPSRLPTPSTAPQRLTAEATIGGGNLLELTSDGDLCFETSGTATCQQGTRAITLGVFVAEVHCSPDDPYALLTGAAPKDAKTVQALLGGNPVAVTAPRADGTFVVRVPAARMDTLRVGDATTAFLLPCSSGGKDVIAAPAG